MLHTNIPAHTAAQNVEVEIASGTKNGEYQIHLMLSLCAKA